MPKREYRSLARCANDGCREHTTFYYDRRADQIDGDRHRRDSPWRCTRHTNPEQMLGADNQVREVVLVASKVRSHRYEQNLADYERALARNSMFARKPDEFLDGLFWLAEGATSGSGFTYGPGFMAYATDFPEGTRLVVTARIEVPAEVVEP
jgi:hypothetical protein